MIVKSFTNNEEVSAWCVEQSMKAKRFAAQNDFWCFTIITLDLLNKDTLSARTVYAEDRVDIESSYSSCTEIIKKAGIPYYITNNFDWSKGFEYHNLLESMVFR